MRAAGIDAIGRSGREAEWPDALNEKPPPRDRQMSKGRLSQSNRLVVLANQIREAHRDVSTLLMRSVERAFTAGELLIEAKQQLSHGGWLEWLREYVEISESTAQRYMRLARNRNVIKANTTSMSDLTVNGALALLTTSHMAEKVFAPIEAPEVIQDKAEAARRRVLLDAVEHNAEAIQVLEDKWVPADFVAGEPPELKEAKEWFDGLMDMGTGYAREYDIAIECGDHATAYALASWLLDLSNGFRSMCEEIAVNAERNGIKPARNH